MTLKIKNSSKYFFSFIPVIAIISYFSIGNPKAKKINSTSKNATTTVPLPCSFPNKGTVNGEAPTFYTGHTIMQSKPDGVSVTTPAPSQVTNGNITLYMQTDGNLVLLNSGVNVWDSGTGARSTIPVYYLVFQGDGNLVLHSGSPQGTVIWAANKYSSCANSQYAYYTLQSDGNFVMQYPETIDGQLSDRGFIYTSYFLAATNTANGAHNSNHKIE
jgi:hypothetical protein